MLPHESLWTDIGFPPPVHFPQQALRHPWFRGSSAPAGAGTEAGVPTTGGTESASSTQVTQAEEGAGPDERGPDPPAALPALPPPAGPGAGGSSLRAGHKRKSVQPQPFVARPVRAPAKPQPQDSATKPPRRRSGGGKRPVKGIEPSVELEEDRILEYSDEEGQAEPTPSRGRPAAAGPPLAPASKPPSTPLPASSMFPPPPRVPGNRSSAKKPGSAARASPKTPTPLLGAPGPVPLPDLQGSEPRAQEAASRNLRLTPAGPSPRAPLDTPASSAPAAAMAPEVQPQAERSAEVIKANWVAAFRPPTAGSGAAAGGGKASGGRRRTLSRGGDGEQGKGGKRKRGEEGAGAGTEKTAKQRTLTSFMNFRDKSSGGRA
jgi:hypothetical protein